MSEKFTFETLFHLKFPTFSFTNLTFGLHNFTFAFTPTFIAFGRDILLTGAILLHWRLQGLSSFLPLFLSDTFQLFAATLWHFPVILGLVIVLCIQLGSNALAFQLLRPLAYHQIIIFIIALRELYLLLEGKLKLF